MSVTHLRKKREREGEKEKQIAVNWFRNDKMAGLDLINHNQFLSCLRSMLFHNHCLWNPLIEIIAEKPSEKRIWHEENAKLQPNLCDNFSQKAQRAE